jgi:hypothetical protein
LKISSVYVHFYKNVHKYEHCAYLYTFYYVKYIQTAHEWKLSPVDQIPRVIENIIKYSNDNNKKLTKQYKDNKSIINRLQIIDKYTKLADTEHLDELIEDEAPTFTS